ncbi:MAG: hypothetical protein E7396_00680 [Ruminococcaceae bacterium]|nr:hypothetical protein [Oscillospiraceae bacterium]
MYVFVFASLTTANRVRFLIKNKLGLSFDINKVSASKIIPGCSYGLFVNKENKDKVWEFIKGLDVNLIGLFEESIIKGGNKDGVS